MSEKSCETCKYYIDGEQCKPEIKCNYNRDGWQPKEDKIRKPIFESVKEFDDFMDNCIYPDIIIPETKASLAIFAKHKAKSEGYIRRSPVEEFEEIYNRYEHHNPDMIKANEAIQYLKKQLEEK